MEKIRVLKLRYNFFRLTKIQKSLKVSSGSLTIQMQVQTNLLEKFLGGKCSCNDVVDRNFLPGRISAIIDVYTFMSKSSTDWLNCSTLSSVEDLIQSNASVSFLTFKILYRAVTVFLKKMMFSSSTEAWIRLTFWIPIVVAGPPYQTWEKWCPKIVQNPRNNYHVINWHKRYHKKCAVTEPWNHQNKTNITQTSFRW